MGLNVKKTIFNAYVLDGFLVKSWWLPVLFEQLCRFR